jgi:hypothetical protein
MDIDLHAHPVLAVAVGYHILAALVVSLGFSAAGLAQTGGVQTAAPPAQASDAVAKALAARTCPLPEIVDQVPLQPVSGSDLMTVPVTVNDTTKQFLLDVALGKPSLVSPKMMEKLSLPEIPKNRGYVGAPVSSGSANFSQGAIGGFGMPYYDVGTGMGSWLLETHVRVHSFGVGNATARHLQFQVADKGLIGRSAPYDGYLTGDFFRQYDVELDFANKQITWLTPSKCIDPNQAVFWAHSEVAIIPISLARDGRYQMQAMVSGHLINAELDTSSPRTVMRRDIAEQDVGLKADTPKMTPLGDLKDGMGMQIYVSNFPEIVFAGGGVTAENVPVMIQDYSMIPVIDRMMDLASRKPRPERIPDLLIGMDVLQHLHMYIVPGVSRVYVTAAEDGAPPAN